MKERADIHLVRNGQALSREKAQALIMSGKVYLAEVRINKASETVPEDAQLTVRGEQDSFASRGGHKLEKAITVFRPSVEGTVAMDIGASTGGFTDVLLRSGARHVYAIDVGYGQLDWRLRNDPRVTVMERTNARFLTPEQFPLHPTLTVMDVSFISIRLILPVAAAIMGGEGQFLTLIKPQFEAGRESVGKHGIVRDPDVHRRVLAEIRDFSVQMQWCMCGVTFSPIRGGEGNIEFLADIRKTGVPVSDEEIARIVTQAHRELAT